MPKLLQRPKRHARSGEGFKPYQSIRICKNAHIYSMGIRATCFCSNDRNRSPTSRSIFANTRKMEGGNKMNERPTPETDAFLRNLNDYSDVELRAMTEYARKLERERDKARSEQSSIQCAFEESQDKIEELERECDEARIDAAQLADRLPGLELRTTEELAKLEQERNASRELAIAFHNDQTNLILLLHEWKDMAGKLVNIASYALGEFDVKLTLDQQRNITETMQQYHSLLKKQ